MACGVMIFRKNLKFEEKNLFIFFHFIYKVECPKVHLKNIHVIEEIRLFFSPSALATISTAIFKNWKKTERVYLYRYV